MTSKNLFVNKAYEPILVQLFERIKEKHGEFGLSYQEMDDDLLYGRILYKSARLYSSLFDIETEEQEPIKQALDVAIYALLLADNIRRD